MISNRLVALALVLAVAAPGAAVAEKAGECGPTYTVGQGDTLSAIATRCGSTVDALVAANPELADPGRLSIGQELAMPGQEGVPALAEEWARERDARAAPVLATGRYTVEPGDSMASIATELGVPLDELLAANEGVDPFALQPGQELILPGEATDAAPAAVDDATQATDVPEPDDEDAPQHLDAPAGEGPPVVQEAAESAPEPERLVLEGRIQKGAECPVLRTPDGQIYSLVSQSYGFTPGDYVAIEGEAVEMSFCMEGKTVRVTAMSAKAAPQGG